MKCSFWDHVNAFCKKCGFSIYALANVMGTLFICFWLCIFTYHKQMHVWVVVLVGVLSFVVASYLISAIINWVATLIIKPKILPKMDFVKFLPSEYRTLIAIPCMLSNESEVEELVEALEVRYLANPQAHLHFALLSDYKDAPVETMPSDRKLLQMAIERIETLNKKYKSPSGDIFFLFHRPRKWNKREKSWMGFERKRGKLSDLNALLRGQGDESDFMTIVGEYSVLTNVKYVITLDSDTQLPREAATKMIATMAHPLNKPVYDATLKRVVDGYTILQPRLAVTLPKSSSSLFTLMHSNDSGLDPYTKVTSDVYQDLFAEGSFIGKGIYDVDIFEKVLKDRFPLNRILSHDLLEGCYTRSGLISDVQLYEGFPGSYLADMARRHRWIRGDWQIAGWALPLSLNKDGHLCKNHLSALSRWKIWDNIRRSLMPIAFIALLIIGWTLLPMPWFWTTIVVLTLFLPVIIIALWHLAHKPKDLDFSSHFNEFVQAASLNFLQSFLYLASLPFEAYYNLDAIVRTNWRMIISNKKLLEWTPSSSSNAAGNKTLLKTYLIMWSAPFVAVATALLLLYLGNSGFLTSMPILVLWVIAPMIVWKISAPRKLKSAFLEEEEKYFLHHISRKTWYFFESFVTEDENWLPPDNFQEHPKSIIAHRTSPTNIGLTLLANLSAYDFGYISINDLILRTSGTFKTMNVLERYQNHFFNWYDTLTLQPLNPKYISTVDSGNLAGHLITLRQGLLSLPSQMVVNENIFSGWRDTLLVAYRELERKEAKNLDGLLTFLNNLCAAPPSSLMDVYATMKSILRQVNEGVEKYFSDTNEQSHHWMTKLQQQIVSILRETEDFLPWLKGSIPEKFRGLPLFIKGPSFLELKDWKEKYSVDIEQLISLPNSEEEFEWLNNLKQQLAIGSRKALEKITLLENLSQECSIFSQLEYRFLYDGSKHLLRIGFNVDEHLPDNSYYDLLASEVRLGIFVAIAQSKLPQECWFTLGRLLVNAGKAPVLLSWSGSMFEYLMPQLVMPSYENTLITQTNSAMVRRQIEYGKQRGVPWGISESGYNAVDTSLNYQYRAFGVPGLGLKRGLGDDLVIAPYAALLALMIAPKQACENLQRLTQEGFEGQYGFYEAIDYTSSRLPRGQEGVLIRSFMVHHQGMGFLSLASLLLNHRMQRRFESDPQFQATLLLLQEKIPRTSTYYSHTGNISQTNIPAMEPQMRIIGTPNTPIPEIQLLSNSNYHVVTSNAGGGYSRWRNIAITRWREDGTRDNWGVFCYIKDIETGAFWSNTYQPVLQTAKNYEAIFSQGHAEYRRIDNGFECRTEVVVSPEDDVEVRRVRITNRNSSKRVLEVTSYAEVVLAPQAADEAHPAFSNLFVQTEILKDEKTILCSRRPRSKEEQPPWMFHLMSLNGADAETISYETDRMEFIGRTNSVKAPKALLTDTALSGSDGSVLDPIVAIRYRIFLKANQTATFDLILGVAETKEKCKALLQKYQDRHLKNRAFELSWTHSQVLLRQINATEAEAQLFNRIAGSIIYPNVALRAAPVIIRNNSRGQSDLWAYSISGDLPIVLLRVQSIENLDLVKQLVKAHVYWRLKGIMVDLVIWNEDFGSYRQEFQDQIQSFVTSANSVSTSSHSGNIFIRSTDQISNEDRILFQSVARIIIEDNAGTLSEQISKKIIAKPLPSVFEPILINKERNKRASPIELPKDLLFYNGFGGFTKDGREYILLSSKDKPTPAPWVNVIANENFGTVVSESGSAYTWQENAHEFRVSPWENDPITDACGEAIYIRDEESGKFWSPTPLPKLSQEPYITRHGFGYSVFEHIEEEIFTQLWVYVDLVANIKFNVLKIKNLSNRNRKLSATSYVELILGDLSQKTSMHIISELDEETNAVFAYNKYNTPFAKKVVFLDVNNINKSVTADRSDFLGRNGNFQNPEAMQRIRLSGKVGAALDPCIAVQVTIDVFPMEEKEIIFKLGVGDNEQHARQIINQFKESSTANKSLDNIHDYWNEALGAVYVETPDAALNILANGWLVYQTLACRVWARSGYYQSGGAFGFRDQLQDVLALLHAKPEIARDQILLAASRQFKEGDVQHWWHPPLGRGVRTTCSDDYLWLPFVTEQYLQITGDKSILQNQVPFLDGRPLSPHEASYYDLPIIFHETDTLYQHCVKAIKHGLQFGSHGLPLMGSGDWNDGMDKVGEGGKGESVWLGFFMHKVLKQFVSIATMQGDTQFASECDRYAGQLKENINKNAWDGQWYRRAYFDDGTPLGSSSNAECRIDSISQSWSIISKAGEEERSKQAMEAVNKYLVKTDDGIILLLDPPFDKSDLNPGYIKGYLPGVRENGGQYTHAAVWTMMAFAEMGDAGKVWELFSMMNPISHTQSKELVEKYKVEPYVMAADVYGARPHKGRGGWTWYTGSAGWMYQFLLQSLLGLKREGDKLYFNLCVPKTWSSFKINYKYLGTYYHMIIMQSEAVDKPEYTLDGIIQEEDFITLVNDKEDHEVIIKFKTV
ncbi:GH36-type glycosyl hydrolase domain-containing protein [Arachidicoccus sp.]|uniref:GH36-type glycosyl hydrolase domain-containing protein n=1 Tax=Arachidicoccus sp. TaxID=1872624 RepID=UPI003D2153D7